MNMSLVETPSVDRHRGAAERAEPQETALERDSRGRTLTIGWAISVVMWAFAYVTMMGPGFAVGEVLVVAMLLAVVVGGAIAARYGGYPAAFGAGAISAGVNMLLIGSLFRGEDRVDPMEAALWIGALWGSTLLCAAIGAEVGRRYPILDDRARWPSRFAWVAVATVFLLLITGGLVTSLREGLAVPDWPNSFGHNMLLYPLSEMKGGIYFEHAHRLYGMLVGLTTIALVWLVWRTDHRRWVRWFSIALLLMVCVQGIKGGLGVTGHPTLSADPEAMRPSTELRLAHGVFGQVVFAALVVVATAVSARWLVERPRVASAATWGDRAFGAACALLLLVQLALGASIRHLREPGDIPAWALHGHIALAVVLIGLLAYWGVRLMVRGRAGAPMLRTAGITVHALLAAQVVLGLAALVVVLLWNTPETPVWLVVPTTAHQATGAALLGAVAWAWAWTWREC